MTYSTKPGPLDQGALARLVSRATAPTWKVAFRPTSGGSGDESICGRLLLLSIGGPRPTDIVLSTDAGARQALAAAHIGQPAWTLTAEMINDSLAELLSRVADELQVALGLGVEREPARLTTFAEMGRRASGGTSRSVLLDVGGPGELRLWVCERPAPGVAKVRPLVFRAFRTALRRLWAGDDRARSAASP